MPTSYVVIPAGSITEKRSQAVVLSPRNASEKTVGEAAARGSKADRSCRAWDLP
jgi:hypothetical protein